MSVGLTWSSDQENALHVYSATRGESCYCPGVVNFIGSTGGSWFRVPTGGLKLFDINACVDVREESIGQSRRIPAMRIVERTVSVTYYRQFEIVYSD